MTGGPTTPWRSGRMSPTWLVAAPAVLAMTVFVTWPQTLYMGDRFASHVDSYFSTWRLMWIAHALSSAPRSLFDANIFYPSTGTLAYSDATLLQGLLAAPLLWAGVSPILVYNLLLLVGFAGSGLAMFVLARYLTGRIGPALVASGIFAMAPYRIEHFMHLELQWTMWMPLTLWALHRALAERSWRLGALGGLFLWLQMISCVYYGVFLTIAAGLLVLTQAVMAPRETRAAWKALAAGALVAAVLTVPYALPYLENARTLGGRESYDVTQFSAWPTDYLVAAELNRLWGWTAKIWGGDERRLFPGLMAILLAGSALARRPKRETWLYVVMALAAIELSFGLNGYLYSWLFSRIPVLNGLRAPARFAIVAQCALAALAALGVRALQDRFGRGEPSRLAGVAAIALLLVTVESSNRPAFISAVSRPNPAAYDVYRAIRGIGPGVIIELPMPTLSSLPGQDAVYAFWSSTHWHPLVNGYSGYYPHVYAETANRMETFPDDESLARLGRLNVRYIIVHREFFGAGQYNELLLKMAAEPRLKPYGTYRDPAGEATLFLLNLEGSEPRPTSSEAADATGSR
jgi:hypothetical protein